MLPEDQGNPWLPSCVSEPRDHPRSCDLGARPRRSVTLTTAGPHGPSGKRGIQRHRLVSCGRSPSKPPWPRLCLKAFLCRVRLLLRLDPTAKAPSFTCQPPNPRFLKPGHRQAEGLLVDRASYQAVEQNLNRDRSGLVQNADKGRKCSSAN